MQNPPCGPCQRDGGYRLTASARDQIQPQESIPPYTGRQYISDERGQKTAECWAYEPMCAHHARQVIEAQWTTATRSQFTPEAWRAAQAAKGA